MQQKSSNLIYLIVFILAALILELLATPLPFLRAAVGLVFALVVPGYALSAFLFADGTPINLERILYILGLSIAIDILTGLAMNFTPWGVKPGPWMIAVAVISAGFALAAILRQTPIVRKKRLKKKQPVINRVPLTAFQAWMFISAALVMGLTVLWLSQPTSANNVQGYTALALVPNKNDPAGCPSISVTSDEKQPVSYTLKIMGDGKALEQKSFTLKPGESWQNSCLWSDQIAGSTTLEADLYRNDRPDEVYRRVYLQRSH